MNCKFYSKLLIVSLLTIQSFAQSNEPLDFTATPNKNEEKDVAIEIGIKPFIPIEYKSFVTEQFQEFYQTHKITLDGEIVSVYSPDGVEKLDSKNSYEYFCKFVSLNSIRKNITTKIPCPECHGSGVKYIYPSVKESGSTGGATSPFVAGSSESAPKIGILNPKKVNCKRCNQTGKIDQNLNLTITCGKYPKLPKTPRELDEEKLQVSIQSGDKNAQLLYASELINGTPIVTRDISKAKDILEKLLIDGYVPALEKYIQILSPNPSQTKNSNISLTEVFQGAEEILSNKELGSWTSENCLKSLGQSILAKKLAKDIQNKKLNKSAFEVSTLITELTETKNNYVFSEIEKIVMPYVELGMPKYKIDEKTLSGIKNLALNLKPEGFYLLGLISEKGMEKPMNIKAAYLFYACGDNLSNGTNLRNRSVNLPNYEKITPLNEILHELSKFKSRGKCTTTFIEAIYNLD
jgi:hypothetical protein